MYGDYIISLTESSLLQLDWEKLTILKIVKEDISNFKMLNEKHFSHKMDSNAQND